MISLEKLEWVNELTAMNDEHRFRRASIAGGMTTVLFFHGAGTTEYIECAHVSETILRTTIRQH